MKSKTKNTKLAFALWVVSSIEWYDFFVYGTAAALVFPAVFFPSQTPLKGVLLSFATFGVAFVARPLGGALFGHIGDTIGRRKALVSSLLAMGVATTLIGLLPSYATIGAAGPIILVVLRFVQGVAAGGQQGGVIVYATESCPPLRRGLYGSFASAGAPGGTVLANITWLVIVAAMPMDTFRAWGWRVPFLVSLILVGVAIVIQLRLEESAAFRSVKKAAAPSARRPPLLEALRAHWRPVVLSAGCHLAPNLNYYLMVTFVISYAKTSRISGLSESSVLAAVLIASAVQLVALPVAGLLSDRFGRRRVFVTGAALLGFWQFAYWPLVNTGITLFVMLALIVGLSVLHSAMYGPMSALFAESFSADVRYSGVSLGVQLGALLGGAFAPVVATALLSSTGSTVPIAIYSAAACAVTFICGMVLTRRAPSAQPAMQPV
jgi:MFS family permease